MLCCAVLKSETTILIRYVGYAQQQWSPQMLCWVIYGLSSVIWKPSCSGNFYRPLHSINTTRQNSDVFYPNYNKTKPSNSGRKLHVHKILQTSAWYEYHLYHTTSPTLTCLIPTIIIRQLPKMSTTTPTLSHSIHMNEKYLKCPTTLHMSEMKPVISSFISLFILIPSQSYHEN